MRGPAFQILNTAQLKDYKTADECWSSYIKYIHY